MDGVELFAASFAALYAAHHVGDYWVQSDTDARHKGDAGRTGIVHCVQHCATYVLTQMIFMVIVCAVTGWWFGLTLVPALLFSGVAHYAADRRERGLMFKLARRIPGKADFLRLGVPRGSRVIETWLDCASCKGTGVDVSSSETNGRCWDCQGGGKLPSALTVDDNPTLGTGAWALDQSWHIATSGFVPALLLAAGAS